jgi:hypothetical protein
MSDTAPAAASTADQPAVRIVPNLFSICRGSLRGPAPDWLTMMEYAISIQGGGVENREKRQALQQEVERAYASQHQLDDTAEEENKNQKKKRKSKKHKHPACADCGKRDATVRENIGGQLECDKCASGVDEECLMCGKNLRTLPHGGAACLVQCILNCDRWMCSAECRSAHECEDEDEPEPAAGDFISDSDEEDKPITKKQKHKSSKPAAAAAADEAPASSPSPPSPPSLKPVIYIFDTDSVGFTKIDARYKQIDVARIKTALQRGLENAEYDYKCAGSSCGDKCDNAHRYLGGLSPYLRCVLDGHVCEGAVMNNNDLDDKVSANCLDIEQLREDGERVVLVGHVSLG